MMSPGTSMLGQIQMPTMATKQQLEMNCCFLAGVGLLVVVIDQISLKRRIDVSQDTYYIFALMYLPIF